MLGIITDYTLITSAYEQLGHIARVRNDILHNGLELWIDGDPLMHNRLKAHLPTKIREYRISSKNTRDMISDLRKIQTHFLFQFMPPEAKPFPHAVAQTRAPWRYKPPAQSPPPKKPRGSNPKRPTQRPPSRG